MKIIEKYHLVSLFMCSILLLSAIGLMWGCSTLKQKLMKKRTENTILSHETIFREQEILNEWNQRELMKYFGSYAVLVLRDGFHFSDSGLVGNSAILHYRTQSLAIENQNDSLSLEVLKEDRTQDETKLILEEIKQFEERESSPKSWWWLLLIPVVWKFAKRLF